MNGVYIKILQPKFDGPASQKETSQRSVIETYRNEAAGIIEFVPEK